MLTVLSVGVRGPRNAYISKMFLSVSSRASPEPIRREGLLPDGQIDPLAGLLYNVSTSKREKGRRKAPEACLPAYILS